MNSEAEAILQGIFYQEPHSYMPEGLGLTLVVCLLVCFFFFWWGSLGEWELIVFQLKTSLACEGIVGQNCFF